MIAVVMVINVLAVLCNIIVLRMAGQHDERMNEKLRRAIFDWLGRLLCRRYKISPETSSKTQDREDIRVAPIPQDIPNNEKSQNDTSARKPELSNVNLNPDLHTLSKEDRDLLLYLARLHLPLADHTGNGPLDRQPKESFQEEWQQAARILDRFFGIFCFLLMVFTLLGVYFNHN